MATKENIAGPSYAYPRYPTEAVGGLLRLGASVERNAQERAPAARRIVAVSNEADPAVNNAVLDQVVSLWRLQGSPVETYEFPAQLGLPHDVIDPNQTEQQVDVVYPVLIELIAGDRGGS
jgi:carboxylesterase